MCVNEGTIVGMAIFIIIIEILSTPVDFLLLIPKICFRYIIFRYMS